MSTLLRNRYAPKLGTLAAFVLIAWLLPYTVGGYAIHVVDIALVFALLAIGMGLAMGIAGQINLAKGNARPIRAEHLQLPAEVKAKLLPNEQYAKAQPIKDGQAWEATSKRLPRMWQESVIINMQ